MAEMWIPAEVLTVPTTTADGLLVAGAGFLLGFAFRETTAAAGATVRLIDGNDGNGQLIYPFTLVANESRGEWFAPVGIELLRGLFLDVAAGSVEGAVMVWTATRLPSGFGPTAVPDELSQDAGI